MENNCVNRKLEQKKNMKAVVEGLEEKEEEEKYYPNHLVLLVLLYIFFDL